MGRRFDPYRTHQQIRMSEFTQDGLTWSMSGIADGNMSFLWGSHDEVLESRNKFLESVGLSLDDCVAVRIQDGDKIALVGQDDLAKGAREIDTAIRADAMLTDRNGLGLFLVVADCLPIIYWDSARRVLGLAHLSWKTSMLGLAGKVVARMQQQFDCKPENIQVFIGPGAKPESYTFSDAIQRGLKEWQPFIRQLSDGQTAIDLFGYNQFILTKYGIPESNIVVSQVDTIGDERFFSHYRAETKQRGDNGRNAVVVMMK